MVVFDIKKIKIIFEDKKHHKDLDVVTVANINVGDS